VLGVRRPPPSCEGMSLFRPLVSVSDVFSRIVERENARRGNGAGDPTERTRLLTDVSERTYASPRPQLIDFNAGQSYGAVISESPRQS
jgi:hypothetical protein